MKIVIAEFENELEAEIAIGHLEAAGIEARLIKDDAGGMLPSLQQTSGVRVLVDEGKRQEAEAVLHEKLA
ncbi:MAG: DUF2007 domain-containing protein [Bacteroidetes bacterium]|nr:DUF2007 domain-containing protein [Bacteroidota bacterium]MCW5894894.1 DUF2007 domain-containing protein [Bacteroidota bacterium]